MANKTQGAPAPANSTQNFKFDTSNYVMLRTITKKEPITGQTFSYSAPVKAAKK
jgi:hypothetical protein